MHGLLRRGRGQVGAQTYAKNTKVETALAFSPFLDRKRKLDLGLAYYEPDTLLGRHQGSTAKIAAERPQHFVQPEG